MSESFYGRPPAVDARHARRRAFDIESALRQFKNTYREAKDRRETKLYERANIERAVIESDIPDLKSILNQLPVSDQDIIRKTISRIEDTLEMHPNFPPPLLRGSESQSNMRKTSNIDEKYSNNF